ncbi:MAG TPA: uracil-DNA glycosylase family protein [Aestuariivirgaceae bacterium]
MSSLETLLAEVRRCRICLEAPARLPPLPHLPRPVLQASADARLLIVGQAPGARVHATGLPFNDPSGDRLRIWLGVARDEFYDARKFAVIPMGFCFPGYDGKGSDLPPRKECAGLWRRRLLEKLPRIETIICLGRHAQAWHMPQFCRASLTETVRNWRAPYEGLRPRVLPLPHPSWRNIAWLRRNPWFASEILPLLRREVQTLTS